MASYSGPDSDLCPDAAMAEAFLSWWFEKTNRGTLEIGWMDSAGKGLIHFQQFALNDLQTLVATAVQENMVAGQTMYFRAATVNSWGAPFGRTTDLDVAQAPGIWSDIDKEEDFEHARTVETMVRPNGSVITGTVPSMRVQSWFRTAEPIINPDLVRSLNVRLHALYGGDPSVVNPSRLMRLPGMIAWPWKAGRIPEIVRFVQPGPEDKRQSSYPISLLTTQLPADDHEQQRAHGPGMNGNASAGAFGMGSSGGFGTVSTLIRAIKAGDQWHNHVVQLTAHWVGRGWSTMEIMGHCPDWTLAGFTIEQTRREVAKAIEGARQKWQRPDNDEDVLSGLKSGRPKILSLTDLDALPAPVWLVHGLVPEKSLVVPYGPPKSGKTFVILSMGLHIAAGLEWFGHVIQQGAVVYIAGEGVGGLSMRLRAMRARYQIGADVPFWVIPRAVNFRDKAEILALKSVISETIGSLRLQLLVVDTLARAMPGADENSAQEVGAAIAAGDWLKEELECTVALIHHEGKDGERGARGTSALRGAWDAAYRITGSGKQSIMTVVDQKDAEAGQRLVFRMEEVPVGIGRSSLVPVLEDTPEESEGRPARDISGHAGLVLQALRDVMAGPESAILPPFSGLPSGDPRGVSVEILRRTVYERMPTVSPEARQKAFVRSVQTLMQRGMIGVRDPWVWLV